MPHSRYRFTIVWSGEAGQQGMESAEREVREWLEEVVIGLNLCPFARGPFQNGLVRISVSSATTPDALLDELRDELTRLQETPAATLETTLIVVTRMLADFDDYNQFLDEVDFVLSRRNWAGVFQVATFHPHYRFEEADADDVSNLTNRSPWPILHILREDSVERAVASYPDAGEIPERNIAQMQSLTAEERRGYFPWLAD